MKMYFESEKAAMEYGVNNAVWSQKDGVFVAEVEEVKEEKFTPSLKKQVGNYVVRAFRYGQYTYAKKKGYTNNMKDAEKFEKVAAEIKAKNMTKVGLLSWEAVKAY